MNRHEKLVEHFNQLCGDMMPYYGAKRACDITNKQWKNITERFARGAKRDEVIGFFGYNDCRKREKWISAYR